MLGQVKSNQDWIWSAYGKHPVVKDFFQFGQKFPLMESFSNWVENGYKILLPKRDANHEHMSWHFWSKGTGKENIACGLVKDSSDAIGRPYPLLIMGTGPLKDWNKQWDLLPYACGPSWGHFEYLSAQTFNDISKFEVEIQNIRPPCADWQELNAKRKNSMEDLKNSQSENYTTSISDLKRHASRLAGKTECIIRLDEKLFNDQFVLVDFWHFLFKDNLKTIPNVIFMGGTIDKTYLAFFNRPLVPDDFIRLWTVSSLESKEKGSPVVE